MNECTDKTECRVKQGRRVYYYDMATNSLYTHNKFYEFLQERRRNNPGIDFMEVVNVWNRFAKNIKEYVFVRVVEVGE